MAFINEVNDALEISRLNGKIKSERARLEKQYEALGELVYRKHVSGEFDEPWSAEAFASIEVSCDIIRKTTAEVDRLRSFSAGPVPDGRTCPGCGAPCVAGAVFCGSCGARLE